MALQLIATRVDDRLIHGQGLAWLTSLPVNTIVVANDRVAKSEFEQDLMLTLVPNSMAVRFFTLEKVISVLHKAADRQKIFLLFGSLEDALTCIEGGVAIKELNVGNIRKKPGSIKISPYVNLLPEQFKTIEKLKKLNIKLNSKQTPMGEAPGETIDFNGISKFLKNKKGGL